MELAEYFASLTEIQRAYFMARLSYELTITYRDVFSRTGLDENIRKNALYGLNEIQHRLSSQIASHIKGKGHLYTPEDFAAFIKHFGTTYGIPRTWAIDHAIESTKNV